MKHALKETESPENKRQMTLIANVQLVGIAPAGFLPAGCSFRHPTNSIKLIKALKGKILKTRAILNDTEHSGRKPQKPWKAHGTSRHVTADDYNTHSLTHCCA